MEFERGNKISLLLNVISGCCAVGNYIEVNIQCNNSKTN